jgi:hypothetical protein
MKAKPDKRFGGFWGRTPNPLLSNAFGDFLGNNPNRTQRWLWGSMSEWVNAYRIVSSRSQASAGSPPDVRIELAQSSINSNVNPNLPQMRLPKGRQKRSNP